MSSKNSTICQTVDLVSHSCTLVTLNSYETGPRKKQASIYDKHSFTA